MNRTYETDIIDEFISEFDGSERQSAIANDWQMEVSEIKYDDLDAETITWAKASFTEAIAIVRQRMEKRALKPERGAAWLAEKMPAAIQRKLEVEEMRIWDAILAHRAAPNDPIAQRWMIS